jgi:repressor LexA
MKELHPKQKKILEILKKHIDNPLTLNALSSEADITSPGVLYHHLSQLEKKGHLKRNPSNPRDFIVMDTPDNPVVYIPKYGTAQCGPDGGILSGDIIDRVPVLSVLLRFPAVEAFVVEAKGDSMEPKISEGDTIIAKKQSKPEDDDIIVCVYNQKVMIKKYCQFGERILLNSINKEHKIIEVTPDDEFKIEGVVKNIIHTVSH